MSQSDSVVGNQHLKSCRAWSCLAGASMIKVLQCKVVVVVVVRKFHQALAITPDPRHQSPSYKTATWPGVIACCGSSHSITKPLSDLLRVRVQTASCKPQMLTSEPNRKLAPSYIAAQTTTGHLLENQRHDKVRRPISN